MVAASCFIGLLLMVALGCTSGPGRGGRGRPGADGGLGNSGLVAGCIASQDADNDGIADIAEGLTADADGDGTPNYLDTDSDGDGLSDAFEHQGAHPCARPDADGDALPNWLDLDSDNDGLTDEEESGTYSTNPYNIDSDGDGITDLGEVRGTLTDPNDPSDSLPPDDFFVVLPYLGAPADRTLRFGTNISVADVYFLVDTTGSMGAPIANVRSSLTRIAAELSIRIPNLQMGVGRFDDFPNESGPFSFGYGAPGDVPYGNLQDITGDTALVQAAVGRLSLHSGGDYPEAQVEALYQTATGEGGSWTFDGTGAPYSFPARTCSVIPDERGRRRGYPCFRPGALPIVVLVTDAAWHNGPMASEPYTGIHPLPRTFAEAATALGRIGARFIGVAVGGGGRAESEEMARRTGTVDGTGTPLVFDAAGGTVSDAIIVGIQTLTGGVAQTVTTRSEDVAGNPDNFDATLFIKAIVPVEGYDSMGIAGAGYDSKDDVAFYGVVPGTQVEFRIDFYNDVRMPAVTAEIFRARIVVVGNGVADLSFRNVYIIVPTEGGTILI